MNKFEAMILAAASHPDWTMVALNGGPPCFHVCKDGDFCLRSERWAGHNRKGDVDGLHEFVSLEKLIKGLIE